MKTVISEYLKEKALGWSPTSIKSESARLNSLASLKSTTAIDIYNELLAKGYKPYTIKTMFIRLSNLEKFAKERNFLFAISATEFMEKHPRLFKNVYQKEELKVDYESAIERIKALKEPYRTAAIELLRSGLRISEFFNVEDGHVVGKGGKKRRVFCPITATDIDVKELRKQLLSIGLKPHSLRKLCATRLADSGASAADLCKVFGWSSIVTANSYLQAKQDDKLASFISSTWEV